MNPATASTEEIRQAILFMDARQEPNERAALSTIYENNTGWNGRDASFGGSLASRIRTGWPLSPKQEHAARKLLNTYKNSQLAGFVARKDISTTNPPSGTPSTTNPPSRCAGAVSGAAIPPKPPYRCATLVDATKPTWHVLITFPYNQQDVELVKAIPGRRWESGPKVWKVPLPGDKRGLSIVLKAIGAFLGEDLPRNPELKGMVEAVYRVESEDAAGAQRPLPFAIASRAYPYQQEGIRHLMRHGCQGLLADEMGLGKTVQAIGAAECCAAGPVIVVCPASLKLNWAREIQMWAGKHAVVLSGKPTEQKMSVAKNGWIVLNYDILSAWLPRLEAVKAGCLILDECHYIKNPKAQRTRDVTGWTEKVKQPDGSEKRVKHTGLAQNIPHVIGLSGTPIINRPVEFFPILNLLDNSRFPSFWKFTQRYCGAKRNRFGWDFTGATNTEELHKTLTESGLMLRRKKADVLKELPPKQRIVVPMTGDMGEYQRVEADFLKWLAAINPEKAASALRAETLVKMETLKQMAVKAKMDSAMEWVRDALEANGKLVVFATHTDTLDCLEKAFPGVTVRIDGSVSMNKRQEAVDKFQSDPSCQLFIGNIKAAGTGITLTAASSTVFMELGWTPGEHDQAEDRIHRIGQTAESIQAYYLLLAGSVEEDIAAVLDHKRTVLARVLDGVAAENDSMLTELLYKMNERKPKGE